jgi:hypothetical protein
VVAAKRCDNNIKRLKTHQLVLPHALHHLCFAGHNRKLLEKIFLFAFRGGIVVGNVGGSERDIQSSLQLTMDQVYHLEHHSL